MNISGSDPNVEYDSFIHNILQCYHRDELACQTINDLLSDESIAEIIRDRYLFLFFRDFHHFTNLDLFKIVIEKLKEYGIDVQKKMDHELSRLERTNKKRYDLVIRKFKDRAMSKDDFWINMDNFLKFREDAKRHRESGYSILHEELRRFPKEISHHISEFSGNVSPRTQSEYQRNSSFFMFGGKDRSRRSRSGSKKRRSSRRIRRRSRSR